MPRKMFKVFSPFAYNSMTNLPVKDGLIPTKSRILERMFVMFAANCATKYTSVSCLTIDEQLMTLVTRCLFIFVQARQIWKEILGLN